MIRQKSWCLNTGCKKSTLVYNTVNTFHVGPCRGWTRDRTSFTFAVKEYGVETGMCSMSTKNALPRLQEAISICHSEEGSMAGVRHLKAMGPQRIDETNFFKALAPIPWHMAWCNYRDRSSAGWQEGWKQSGHLHQTLNYQWFETKHICAGRACSREALWRKPFCNLLSGPGHRNYQSPKTSESVFFLTECAKYAVGNTKQIFSSRMLNDNMNSWASCQHSGSRPEAKQIQIYTVVMFDQNSFFDFMMRKECLIWFKNQSHIFSAVSQEGAQWINHFS